MRCDRYILLPDHTVREEPDLLTWARWFEDGDARRVDLTEIVKDGVTYSVSTVFLGLDHGFGVPGPPVLFETMVFFEGPPNKRDSLNIMARCSTWDEAVAQHARIVARIEAGEFDADPS